MKLTKADMEKIRPAVQEISDGIGKTLATYRGELAKKHGLPAEHVNIAIARAMIATASGAWAAAWKLPADASGEILAELDEVLIKKVEQQ